MVPRAKAFFSHTYLTELDFTRAYTGDRGASIISLPLGKLPFLRHLFLQDNGLTCGAIEVFTYQITKVTSLEDLDLSCNQIDARGVKLLVKCTEKLTALNCIDITQN